MRNPHGVPHFGRASGIVTYLSVTDRPSISKRAARRLIQQAFVLTGRDRSVRQHIREAHIETLWVLEDWRFEWTVIIDRGKVRFERRPSRTPGVTLTWAHGTLFFDAVQEGRAPDDSRVLAGDLGSFRTFVEPVYKRFCRSLEEVIKYPVDDAGNPLM